MDAEEICEAILYYFFLPIHGVITVLKITVIIFLISEWNKTNSIFRSGYFIILNFGYLSELGFSVCLIYGHLIHYSPENPFISILYVIQWHSQFILGFWNTILALNQCTAFAYPFIHSKLWKGKLKIAGFLLLLFFFPFIINGYSFRDLQCKLFNFFQPECALFYRETYFVLAIVNIIFGNLSLFFVIFGISKSPKNRTESSSKIRMERRLIIQTSLSSTLLILNFVALAFATIFCEFAYQLGLLSYFFHLIQYYPPVGILFIVSPIFRQKFLTFYGLQRFLKSNRRCGTNEGTTRYLVTDTLPENV